MVALACAQFRRRCDGVATIEFAVLLPFLLFIVFGTFEAAEVLRASMKVATAAENVADLIAQQSSVTDTTSGSLGKFCSVGKLVMTPLATSGTSGNPGAFSAAMISVTNNAGTASDDWESDGACSVTATSFKASAVTLATQAVTNGVNPSCASGSTVDLVPCAGDSIIVVKVTYVYNLPLNINLGAILLNLPGSFQSVTLTYVAYARPRGNVTISCTEPSNGNACSS